MFRHRIDLAIHATIGELQGSVTLNETGSTVQHTFVVHKVNNSIFRSLSIQYAIAQAYENGEIRNALPGMIEVFGKAGLKVSMPLPYKLLMDRSDNLPWSTAEINDLLALEFPEVSDEKIWPDWKCYALIISRWKEDANAIGVTFDNSPPYNQGIAIFSGHQKLALTHPLVKENTCYAWIHEIGHLIGLSHNSKNPNSWMQEHLPDLNREVPMAFSKYDIWVIRHNFTAYAIPGYRSGMAMLLDRRKKRKKPSSKLELTLRSYGTYYTAEPVELEVRIRNHSKRRRTICPCLNPEGGLLSFKISHQDKNVWLDYCPYVHYHYGGDGFVLQPEGHVTIHGDPSGADRFSQWVSISNGYNGLPLFKLVNIR